jgi:hypothetical protein
MKHRRRATIGGSEYELIYRICFRIVKSRVYIIASVSINVLGKNASI